MKSNRLVLIIIWMLPHKGIRFLFKVLVFHVEFAPAFFVCLVVRDCGSLCCVDDVKGFTLDLL